MKITADTTQMILEAARWAPSGDNSQPWSFRVVSPQIISLSWKSTESVYDHDGWSTRLAIGALLESIRLAASMMNVGVVFEGNVSYNTLTVRLVEEFRDEDPLASYLELRRTNRFCYSPFSLWKQEKQYLETVIPSRYSVLWFDSLADKGRIALLNSQTMGLRLSLKEAYDSHVKTIDWTNDRSPDKIPARALGLSRLSIPVMRWVMEDWERAKTMFKYGGKIFPQLEMEILPSLCTGSFAMVVDNAPDGINYRDDIIAGSFIQRFWLTAAGLGLQLQPQMSPLIFARYAERGVWFTTNESAYKTASNIANKVMRLSGGKQPVWFCRIGRGHAHFARSTRKEV